MKIIGIDPGVAITGYGIVEEQNGRWRKIDSGCILTNSKDPAPDRLAQIFGRLEVLIEYHRPRAISIEKLFFCKNTRTALQVGEARGVVILSAALHKIELYEYTPLQIKKAVSGFGKADKIQVEKMVQALLHLTEIPPVDDEADALAAAICHLQHRRWQQVTGEKA